MKHLSLASIIILIFLIREPVQAPEYLINFQNQPSAIGTPEDPLARLRYETSLVIDPATGTVPSEIHEKELVFARTIPDRTAYYTAKNQRVAARDYILAGPYNVGGRTRKMVMDSRDENIIIAGGVSGSVWKTTNGGNSWRKTSDPTNRNSVTTIAQDTRAGKEDIWYYGTGELIGNSARTAGAAYRGDGIYKSTDGGESWQILPSTDEATPDEFTSQFQYIWNIETNHTNLVDDELLVAAYGGILRSLDGGTSWELKIGQRLFGLADDVNLNESDAPFYTSIKKTSQGNFFATLSSSSSSGALSPEAGIYFSPDGKVFTEITPPQFPAYHERTVIAFSGDERHVYFLTEEGDQGQVSFWRFDISGYNGNSVSGSWTELTSNIPEFGGDFGDYDTQIGYNMIVAVHPENLNVIYMGGTNLYRSTDGFTSPNATKWIGGYSPVNTGAVYPGHYPDQHYLVFYPSDPDKMLSATDGGLRLTTNNLADSVRWSSLNNGYVTSQFYTIAQQDEEVSQLILGGMQDNGSYLRGTVGENPSWNRILGGDGGYCAIAPDESFFYVSFQESQIYRLTLTSDTRELTSYARVDPVGGGEDQDFPYLFINPFLLDPLNENRMYLAGGNELWKNTNLTQIPAGSQEKTSVNWNIIPDTEIFSGVYTALEKARDRDILYAGITRSNPLIIKIKEPASNQEQVSIIDSHLFPNSSHLICIAVNPEDADHFLVVFSNYHIPSLFMTTDGGASFEDISGNLEEFPDGSGNGPSVRWAEIVPKTNGYEYFVGTSVGLYSTTVPEGNETVWVKESEEEIGHAVIAMMDYRATDGRLLVATHGNGTFEIYLEDVRPYENQPVAQAKPALSQNYPNPFNEATTIEFTIPEDGEVRIDLYDNAGKVIKNILWGPHFKGTSQAIWDGTNSAGSAVKPGVYHYVLRYGNTRLSKSLIYRP